MKFGKRMRSLATSAWADDYVDYKQLKKVVNTVAASLPCATTGDAAAVFLTALDAEMQRLNDAHARIYRQLAERELPALQAALGNRWVFSPPRARTLLLDALDLSERVDAFRRFIVLNSLAVVKITKKFDKLVPQREDEALKEIVLDKLKQQSFYDDARVDALCAATSAVTDRIMLCVLPDGNFRINTNDVSCPICLQSEIKSALTLSCGHTFCWPCLSSAVAHRFQSCPLCRRVQSVDPRDYAVDGLLIRFTRAYAFVEQALDRAPLAASAMRQILVEAFELVRLRLSQVEAQYAALSPRPQTTSSDHDTHADEQSDEGVTNKTQGDCKLHAHLNENGHELEGKCQLVEAQHGVVAPGSPTAVEEATEVVQEVVLAKGDPVEVHYNGDWYPGMILQDNDDGTTFSVLWWVEDSSQRVGQRMARHLLRPAVYPEQSHFVLFDFAAGAWKTAFEWALGPLRRLRSLSRSESLSITGDASSV